MLMKGDYFHHAWVYFLRNKSDSEDAFTECFADARANGVRSKTEIVRSDNGWEFFGGKFGEVCENLWIKQEFTNADYP